MNLCAINTKKNLACSFFLNTTLYKGILKGPIVIISKEIIKNTTSILEEDRIRRRRRRKRRRRRERRRRVRKGE